MLSSSPERTPKFQLTAEPPLTAEWWIPPKKIPNIQGQRRSPDKMIGGVKSHLESNPTATRDSRRAQIKPCVHQDPETPQRPSQPCLWVSECLLWSHRSAVACRGDGASRCSRPGRHGGQCKVVLEEVAISPTIGPPRR